MFILCCSDLNRIFQINAHMGFCVVASIFSGILVCIAAPFAITASVSLDPVSHLISIIELVILILIRIMLIFKLQAFVYDDIIMMLSILLFGHK